MIDAKQAVQIAREKAVEILGESSTHLEEIDRETHRGSEVWSITLSLPRPADQLSAFAQLTADPVQYKRFLVDSETGELIAMKIREVASQ